MKAICGFTLEECQQKHNLETIIKSTDHNGHTGRRIASFQYQDPSFRPDIVRSLWLHMRHVLIPPWNTFASVSCDRYFRLCLGFSANYTISPLEINAQGECRRRLHTFQSVRTRCAWSLRCLEGRWRNLVFHGECGTTQRTYAASGETQVRIRGARPANVCITSPFPNECLLPSGVRNAKTAIQASGVRTWRCCQLSYIYGRVIIARASARLCVTLPVMACHRHSACPPSI